MWSLHFLDSYRSCRSPCLGQSLIRICRPLHHLWKNEQVSEGWLKNFVSYTKVSYGFRRLGRQCKVICQLFIWSLTITFISVFILWTFCFPCIVPMKKTGWADDHRITYSTYRVYLRINGVLTVVIYLVRVGHQPAVIWSRRQCVRNTVIIIIIVTFISQSIFICVQLGAVNYQWAVVFAILVTITIAEGYKKLYHRSAWRNFNRNFTVLSDNSSFGVEQKKQGSCISVAQVMDHFIPILICVARISNKIIVNVRLGRRGVNVNIYYSRKVQYLRNI